VTVYVEDELRSDVALLADVAGGSSEAVEVLYRRHAPWLLLRLSRRCPDATVVDEVIQDTFVAVWRSAGKYAGGGEVAAWIWGIAIRRLVDALRRRPRPTAVLSDVGETRELMESAEDLVLLGVQHGDLGTALDRLSPHLREVVQATILDGLTSREAGHLLGLPTGTVKTRMMRARVALREELA
jgi:RNA polymerase sigma-70 factor (ECF subfamily)